MTLTPGGANKLHYSMRVSDVAGRKPPPDGKTKPDHWVDNIGSAFQNPWPSFRKPWLKDMLTVRCRFSRPRRALTETNIRCSTRFGDSRPLIRRPAPLYPSANRHGVLELMMKKTPAKRLRQHGSDTPASCWNYPLVPTLECVACAFCSTLSSAKDVRLVNGWVRNGILVSLWAALMVNPEKKTLKSAAPCKIEEIPEIDAVIISVSCPFTLHL